MRISEFDKIFSQLSSNDKKELLSLKKYNEQNRERKEFIKKFNPNFILNKMKLDDYVEADGDKRNFCYLIERKLGMWGGIGGATVNKFGVYKENGKYKVTKIWNKNGNVKEGFKSIKFAIFNLIDMGKKEDFDSIENSKISPLFKSKILSLYYPNIYLPIHEEAHVNIFLTFLNIHYNPKVYNTIEKKKKLLLEFKNNNKEFKKYNNSIFVRFLYRHIKPIAFYSIDDSTKEINDSGIEEVDWNYIKNHIKEPKGNKINTTIRDYNIENQNKKAIGDNGEEAIFRYEKNKLKSMGLKDLAKKVKIVSDDNNLGYDILSYDPKGKEIHIEVKTKNSSKEKLDFFITNNELDKFYNDRKYKIYYLFDIKNENPKLHIVDSKMFKKEFLQPVLYKVDVEVEKKKRK